MSLALRAALRASVPVLLGYVTIGLAFGLVLVDSGLPWWLSPVMAIFVYAGAAQFMGVGLLSSGVGLGELAVFTLLLNARHAVYGLSMLKRFSGAGKAKPYLIFGLTDETYGLLSTIEAPAGVEASRFYTLVTGLDQFYWVFGCFVGALLGAALPFDSSGLDFALSALFVVLLVEQARAVRRVLPFAIAVAASALALALGGSRNFLLLAIVLAIAGLLAVRSRLSAEASGKGTAV